MDQFWSLKEFKQEYQTLTKGQTLKNMYIGKLHTYQRNTTFSSGHPSLIVAIHDIQPCVQIDGVHPHCQTATPSDCHTVYPQCG